MPVIHVAMLEGRSRDQKARLAHSITQAFVEIAKAPAEQVTVIFTDHAKENWAVGGKLLNEDVAYGSK